MRTVLFKDKAFKISVNQAASLNREPFFFLVGRQLRVKVPNSR